MNNENAAAKEYSRIFACCLWYNCLEYFKNGLGGSLLNVLFIGDIVGSSGRLIIKENLGRLKEEHAIDVCVANAENSAAGLGVTGSIARELYSCGVDIITLGNHTWSKNELFNYIDSDQRMVRPANGAPSWPGKGFCVMDTPCGNFIVINLLGRVGMDPANCPFEIADLMVDDLKAKHHTRMTLIDFHAEATSEKQAFGRYFDGRVSLVVGTHTHVQTADEVIFERGTGFITDVGMTGPYDSVIGMEANNSIRRFVERIPVPYLVAKGPSMMSFIVASIDEKSGQTTAIQRMCIR